MAAEPEYFLQPRAGGPDEPPRSLWRRTGDRWEFYSLIDWSWREPASQRGPAVPPSDRLTPLTAAQAAALTADRHAWVRYWAWHRRRARTPADADRPVTVVRRRHSPEQRLDEGFSVDGRWEPTDAIIDWELGRTSSPPRLVEIDQPRAEQLLRELRGVEGATAL